MPFKLPQVATGLFTVVYLAMVPLSSFVPSAISLYWTVSAASALAVTLGVMSPRVRNAAR